MYNCILNNTLVLIEYTTVNSMLCVFDFFFCVCVCVSSVMVKSKILEIIVKSCLLCERSGVQILRSSKRFTTASISP